MALAEAEPRIFTFHCSAERFLDLEAGFQVTFDGSLHVNPEGVDVTAECAPDPFWDRVTKLVLHEDAENRRVDVFDSGAPSDHLPHFLLPEFDKAVIVLNRVESYAGSLDPRDRLANKLRREVVGHSIHVLPGLADISVDTIDDPSVCVSGNL